MYQIIPLLEQFHDGKHLVVVDVQKEFGQWMPQDYVQKVHDLCGQYGSVHQVWDANRAEKPSEKFSNEQYTVPKHYGYDLKPHEIEMHFPKEVQPGLKSDYTEGAFVEGEKRKAYPTVGGELMLYVGKGHKFFMAEKPLLRLAEFLRNCKCRIDLCGGARNECLADVEALFDHYGIPYDTLEEYVYGS